MIELRDLRKAYKTGDFVQKALDGVSLTFRDNEFVAVLGPSGSGKTTLLNVLGGLDTADEGDIVINGTSTKNYRSADWDTYRNHRIGFIFQSYNLIPHQSVAANVELALTLAGIGRAERRQRAIAALERVGLAEHAGKKPNQLSGGQMQRVAIARALVNDPDIVLADEPTGALDTETGVQVMNLLQEIASDRLVIMVTHNPELAERYATRIVRLSDGRIVSDTNPVNLDELSGAQGAPAAKSAADAASDAAAAAVLPVAVAADAARESAMIPALAAAGPSASSAPANRTGRAKADPSKRARMGFLTALGLSFNNLMTKKGRTFMTAFAGSIGIIGIAAILSLSNGVNNYIADTEEQALTSYPLTITRSSFDMTSLFAGSAGIETEEDEQSPVPAAGADAAQGRDGASSQSSSSQPEEVSGNTVITEIPIMTDMFAQVKNNDLASFKTFLDSEESGIAPYVNMIEYTYGIVPNIYKADTSGGVRQLNPSSMGYALTGGVDVSAFGMSGSGTEMFNQMMDNKEMLHDYMEVLEGRWPEKYDEVALVLSSTGRITDYTLYSIGYYDPEIMDQMTQDALNGKEVTAHETAKDFTYDKALGMEFVVVPASSLYDYNADQGIWTDISNDEKIMKQRIANGVKLKVVGVLKPAPDAKSIVMQQGIAYTPALTDYLMQQAASSSIAKQQKGNPDVDVFTGKSFEELQDEQGSNFDFGSMFTVDEQALQDAFSMDEGAFDFSSLSQGFDMSSLDFGSMDASALNLDASSMQLDPSALTGVFSEDSMRSLMANAPQFDIQSAGMTQQATQLTDDQQQQLQQATDALSADFLSWAMTNNKLSPSALAQMPTAGASAQAAQQAAAQQQAAQAAQQQAQQAAADSADAQAAADAAAQALAEAQAQMQQAQSQAQDAASSDDAAQQALEQAQEAAQQAAADQQAAAQAAEAAAAQAAAQQAASQAANQTAADPQSAGFAALFQEYLQTDSAQAILQPVTAQFGTEVENLVNSTMQNYMANQFIPYFSNGMQAMMTQAAQAMALQMAQAMQTQMATVTQSLGSTISNAISGQLSSKMSELQNTMQEGFKFDPDAFANAIQFNMTQDDLTSLLTNFLNADELTYDANMKRLGYAEKENPETINIYPVDFNAKQSVLDIIDNYNSQAKKSGNEDSSIQYSDIAGVLMSSVTDIVDTISLVLIAFVSISLVVSSIMIGIITYISVLERKKEIGILRAMGASKRNIANVFNAETFIEGLVAGVLAIAVVLAVSVPVNAFVEAGWNVPNIMSLPWTAALALIGISVVLTFIAGLIPSQSASRRDPVEALRAE